MAQSILSCTSLWCVSDSSGERGVPATRHGEVREPRIGGGGQLRDGAQVSAQGDWATGGHQEVPGERGRQNGQEDRSPRGQDAEGKDTCRCLMASCKGQGGGGEGGGGVMEATLGYYLC